MKKRIYPNALLLGLICSSAYGVDTLVSVPAASSSDTARVQQASKILASVPKKIRISTKKSASITVSKTHGPEKSGSKAEQNLFVSQESGPGYICKAEQEVNQSLADLQTIVLKKGASKSIFDVAINHLAQSQQEQQLSHNVRMAGDAHMPNKAMESPSSKSILMLDAALDFLQGSQKNERMFAEPQLSKEKTPELKKMVDITQSLFVAPQINAQHDYASPVNDNIMFDHEPEYLAVDMASGNPEVYRNGKIRPERKRIYLGRAYNYAVIDEEEEKHFVIPSSVFASFIFNAFDDCNRKVSFANYLLGGQLKFTVGDIFLESRLSQRIVGLPEEDKSLLFLEPGGPGTNVATANGGPPQFGNRRRQQYLGLLAPVQVTLGTDLYEVGAQSGLIYRFFLDCEEKTAAAAGFIVPIISRFQTICIEFQNGKLFDRTEFAAKDATYRESSIARFFNDFSALEDFFIRAVLLPKGITIEKRQNRTGIGDITMFGLIDAAAHFKYLDGLQFGMNFTLPTSNKAKGNQLFEIELDEGGAFQIDLFSNVIFNSGNKYFNPAFYVAGNFAIPFTARKRVPKLVTHTQLNVDPANPGAGLANEHNRVTNIPGLIAPVFREFFALSFSELDSLVPAFADRVSTVRFNRGPRVDIGIGNYFFDVYCCNYRLGIFYDFMAKGDDEVCPLECDPVKANAFDTSRFGCLSEYAHRIGFNLTYKFECGELNVGAQFVVAGKNTPKRNEAFASFIAIF